MSDDQIRIQDDRLSTFLKWVKIIGLVAGTMTAVIMLIGQLAPAARYVWPFVDLIDAGLLLWLTISFQRAVNRDPGGSQNTIVLEISALLVFASVGTLTACLMLGAMKIAWLFGGTIVEITDVVRSLVSVLSDSERIATAADTPIPVFRSLSDTAFVGSFLAISASFAALFLNGKQLVHCLNARFAALESTRRKKHKQ